MKPMPSSWKEMEMHEYLPSTRVVTELQKIEAGETRVSCSEDGLLEAQEEHVRWDSVPT
jgi:hypothetical protein